MKTSHKPVAASVEEISSPEDKLSRYAMGSKRKAIAHEGRRDHKSLKVWKERLATHLFRARADHSDDRCGPLLLGHVIADNTADLQVVRVSFQQQQQEACILHRVKKLSDPIGIRPPILLASVSQTIRRRPALRLARWGPRGGRLLGRACLRQLRLPGWRRRLADEVIEWAKTVDCSHHMLQPTCCPAV